MEGGDDYELLPRQKVEQLKGELDKYKKNPLYDPDSQDRLLSSILSLEKAINNLYALFESVNKDMLSEYEQGEKPDHKLTILLDQNKRIISSINSIEIMIGNLSSKGFSNTNDNTSFGQQGTENRDAQQPQQPQQSFQSQPNPQGQRENQGMTSPRQEIRDNFSPPPKPDLSTQEWEPPPTGKGFKEQISQGYGNYYEPRQQFVKPNYPSPDEYPEVQGKKSELGTPLDIKPAGKKKKFMGLF